MNRIKKNKFLFTGIIAVGIIIPCIIMISFRFEQEGKDHYVNEEVYSAIKEIYGTIDFEGQFNTGDASKHDFYKKQFFKLMNGEIPVVNQKTGEKIYIYDLGEFRTDVEYNEFDVNKYLYYFFDMDGDEAPELCVSDNARYTYVFKYEEEADQVIVWQEYIASTLFFMGTRKLGFAGGLAGHGLISLDTDGEYAFSVRFKVVGGSEYINESEEYGYLVALPEYVEAEQWMLEQAVYDEADERYYFRVTQQQYEELTQEYDKAVKKATEDIKSVTYTYEELFKCLPQYISQTNYTTMTYEAGTYYYQSAAHSFYLYRSDESGEHQECLIEQVPKELYVVGEWIYFTNLSQGSELYRIKTDGGNMELVCSERIARFLPIGDSFYCMSEEESGTNRIFSCTANGEMQTLFEGECRWICTDGKRLYLSTVNQASDGGQLQTIVMDVEGNIVKEYENCFQRLTPTEKYLYYCSQSLINNQYVTELERLDQDTGETEKYEIPKLSGRPVEFSYAVINGMLYVLCYSDKEPLEYEIFLYNEDKEAFEALCPQTELEGRDTLWDKIEDIYLVNGKIFFKKYAGEGRGELWHCMEGSGGIPAVFEEMPDAAAVDTSLGGDFLYCGYREGNLEQDIEYDERTDDGRGNTIVTSVILPEISDAVPAADEINKRIREDAEAFYQERLESHYTVGYFQCNLAYADDEYVSIVYRKLFGTDEGYESQEYVTRLYSSKTGEEIQAADLFRVSWEEAALRLSFLIRKTECAFDLFEDDLFLADGTYMSTYYCLTGEGLDIFFVEDMRTFKEYHFVIPYKELGDIWND